jgi:TRAP transporter TAXI family solute receptor
MGSRFTKQKIIGLFSKAYLAMGGLTPKDVEGVPVPTGSRQVDDFMAGNIDVVVWSISSGSTRQAHASVGGIRVISLPNTASALSALQRITPGAIIETINPAPVFPGVSGPTNIVAAPFVLLASTKTPQEVVYKAINAIHGNQAKLVGVHKAFKDMDQKRLNIDIGVPYHAGAQKFFKEMGL